MIKANIMPIVNSDMTILLKLCSFLWFFDVFDQKNCAVKKKHVHKQRKEIHRLLSKEKFFNLITETNSLRKDTNRLLSKGMLNIYSKVTSATFSKLRFSRFKKIFTRSVFGELQLTQIWLNFKSSYCNLKIIRLGAKLCVAFLLF